MEYHDHPLLARLSDDERARFVTRCERVEFKAGTELIEEGTHGNCIYFIVAGRLQVYTRIAGGREHELAIIEAPAVIGEMEAFTADARAASVRTASVVSALSLAFDQLRERIDEGDPVITKVVFETARVMARRLAAMNQKFAEIRQGGGGNPVRELGEFHRKLLQDWSV